MTAAQWADRFAVLAEVEAIAIEIIQIERQYGRRPVTDAAWRRLEAFRATVMAQVHGALRDLADTGTIH